MASQSTMRMKSGKVTPSCGCSITFLRAERFCAYIICGNEEAYLYLQKNVCERMFFLLILYDMRVFKNIYKKNNSIHWLSEVLCRCSRPFVVVAALAFLLNYIICT